MQNSKTESSVSRKVAMYVFFLLIWFVGLGLVSFLPFLSDGVSGKPVTLASIVCWGIMPISIGIAVFGRGSSSTILLINICVWAGFTTWVWFHL